MVATPRDPCVYEFQGALRQSTNAAASVASYGGAKNVSPEDYVATLRALSPDAAVLLSDEVPADAKRTRTAVAADRTIVWLERCLAATAATAPKASDATTAPPALFACVQGGTQMDHRVRCANGIAPHLSRLAGVCVGGLGTGESPAQRSEIISISLQGVPADKARMAVGLGCPEDILAAVAQGVDLFDFSFGADVTAGGYALCFPIDDGSTDSTNGDSTEESTDADDAALYGRDDTKMNLWATAYRLDQRPLVRGCPCLACRDHTRAYLHHLLQAHEMTAQVLLEAHNTTHCLRFFEAVRAAVGAGRLGALRERMAARKARWAAGMAGAET
jgi:queuine tRNA-ribosyltransferase subunit QTRTD1